MDATRTSNEAELDKLVNPETASLNAQSIMFVRNVMGIASGVACGVLGLTSLYGLAFYLGAHVATALLLLEKMNFRVSEFVPGETSPLSFVFSGMGEQAMSFIMFWTLSFAVVHIY